MRIFFNTQFIVLQTRGDFFNWRSTEIISERRTEGLARHPWELLRVTWWVWLNLLRNLWKETKQKSRSEKLDERGILSCTSTSLHLSRICPLFSFALTNTKIYVDDVVKHEKVGKGWASKNNYRKEIYKVFSMVYLENRRGEGWVG